MSTWEQTNWMQTTQTRKSHKASLIWCHRKREVTVTIHIIIQEWTNEDICSILDLCADWLHTCIDYPAYEKRVASSITRLNSPDHFNQDICYPFNVHPTLFIQDLKLSHSDATDTGNMSAQKHKRSELHRLVFSVFIKLIMWSFYRLTIQHVF